MVLIHHEQDVDFLKKAVLERICALLHPHMRYSGDNKYSFNDRRLLGIDYFSHKNYSPYRVVDSIQIKRTCCNKEYVIHGYAQDMIYRRRGSHRLYLYILRASFPKAQLPLKNDIAILSDTFYASVLRASKTQWAVM